MKSIQARLMLALAATSMALVVIAGSVLYRSISSYLVGQFDGALSSQASAISSLVSFNERGQLEFEYNEAATLERQFWRDSGGYYVVRYDDGRIFAKSASLRIAPSALAGDFEPRDVTLPDGQTGRMVGLNFVPQREPDAPPPAAGDFAPMSITFARDRAALDASRAHMLSGLAVAGALLTGAILGATFVIVRRSLSPLNEIASRATQITPSTLELRFPSEGVPAEILPICQCLNELLDRLDAAFVRERRFSSDIAHELRTPIAELRSLADVALRWPEDSELARDGLLSARQIANQMQTLVTTLLALVRAERMPQVALRSLSLRKACVGALDQISAELQTSRVELCISEDAYVRAEPTLLGSVLRNILANALEYGKADEPVRCDASRLGHQWLLSVHNPTTRLLSRDIGHVFEPFWRKDAARSDSSHSGLGLSLVKAYCDLMQIEVRAELIDPAMFEIRLSIPAGPEHPSEAIGSSSSVHLPSIS